MRTKLEMTILFADIRGFSNMMDKVSLEDVANFLDKFYAAMAKAVFENGGNVDKFIGDEVMAFFGAPNELKNSGENALNTAREMIASFDSLKETFSEISPYFENLGIGIGVNTGEVFIGNVGSNKRYEYTVIGNEVNLARRLCASAKPGQILASEHTLNRMHGIGSSAFVNNIFLKGVSDPVNAYKIE